MPPFLKEEKKEGPTWSPMQNTKSISPNSRMKCRISVSAVKPKCPIKMPTNNTKVAPSDIPVNALACGVIDTDMNRCFSEEERQALMEDIPAGRFGTPEEAADLAFQILRAPAYMTGQIVTMDGGWI